MHIVPMKVFTTKAQYKDPRSRYPTLFMTENEQPLCGNLNFRYRHKMSFHKYKMQWAIMTHRRRLPRWNEHNGSRPNIVTYLVRQRCRRRLVKFNEHIFIILFLFSEYFSHYINNNYYNDSTKGLFIKWLGGSIRCFFYILAEAQDFVPGGWCSAFSFAVFRPGTAIQPSA